MLAVTSLEPEEEKAANALLLLSSDSSHRPKRFVTRMSDMRHKFNTDSRLTKQYEFDAVKLDGVRKRFPTFVFQILIKDNPQASPSRRLGVIASRKTGNSVKRSKAKRIFREIFRKNQESLPKICDLVIIVFSNFDKFSYAENERYFRTCCNIIRNG